MGGRVSLHRNELLVQLNVRLDRPHHAFAIEVVEYWNTTCCACDLESVTGATQFVQHECVIADRSEMQRVRDG